MVPEVGRGAEEVRNVPVGFGGELPAHSQGNRICRARWRVGEKNSLDTQGIEKVVCVVLGGEEGRGRNNNDQRKKRVPVVTNLSFFRLVRNEA
jgi:hypothetical protein